MWTHPLIIETLLSQAIWASMGPAYYSLVIGHAGATPIAISNIAHDALMFGIQFLFTSSKSWRTFIAKNLNIILALDIILNSISAVLLGAGVLRPSVYIIIVPLFECTLGATVLSVWLTVPTSMFKDKVVRKRYDQINRQARTLGAIIGNLLAILICLGLRGVCVFSIAFTVIDNIYLIVLRHKHRDLLTIESIVEC